MSQGRDSLSAVVYGVRCAFGAWLLREHVAAALESVENARTFKPAHRERLAYTAIGLKRAVGVPGPWRRFDDEQGRLVKQAAEEHRHAKDAL